LKIYTNPRGKDKGGEERKARGDLERFWEKEESRLEAAARSHEEVSGKSLAGKRKDTKHSSSRKFLKKMHERKKGTPVEKRAAYMRKGLKGVQIVDVLLS